MTDSAAEKRRIELHRLLTERRREADAQYRQLLAKQQSGEAAGDSEGVHGWKASREGGADLGVIEALDHTLHQIDDALTRLHTGRYGVCAGCEKSIPLARLKALPFATRCIACQEGIEGRK
ncbi:MAG: TraR/DksA family transcriptional regulator [Acidobacteria bacterium]|nr:TraR/DksA family transcriptional regulator [Acidobacteriota bacterium]